VRNADRFKRVAGCFGLNVGSVHALRAYILQTVDGESRTANDTE